MRWLNTGLIFLILFSLFIQPTYGSANPAIQIDVNGTNDLPVKEATIEVFSFNVSNASSLYLYSNENGTAFFQGEQNQTYTFKITAENYEPVSKNITISPFSTENKLKFSLTPLKSLKDSGFFPVLIPALLGLLMFIFWAYRFYNNHVSPPWYEKGIRNSLLLLSLFSWIPVIIYLLYKQKDYIVLSDNLRFPVYIPVAALIGVLSYLLMSIEEIFSQKIHVYKKKSIVYGYLRRIIIAPYIAILGVYILLDAVKIQNLWFVLFFSFFTGMFTKTIEVWLYKSVQGLLPEELRNEVKERDKYNVENSELVVRLSVEEDVANHLYLYNNIDTVEQLAVADFHKLKNKEGIIEKYFDNIVKKASIQIAKIDELKEYLNLTSSELNLLTDKAKVYSIKDFANVDIDSINWEAEVATENTKISNRFNQKQIKAKEFAKYEDFKLLTLEDLIKSRDISTEKADYFDILSLHSDIRAVGISNWTVEYTKKLLDLQIKTLDELKTRCINQGKDNVKKELHDISVISELIDKIIESKIPSS
ncbi:MAG: hypothetical protein PHU34_04610 [Candidatus Methanoperedens sp.]|nr:hypothetical protein [Candidatus Methanoperedens sp.]